MSQQSTGTKSFTSGETLAVYRRVKISGATVIYADATDRGIGVVQRAVGTSGDEATVRLDIEGTSKMVAAGVISAGADVYAAADGKISASGTIEIGKAIEAATANGDVIEVLPVADKAASVSDLNVFTSDFITDASDTVTNASDIAVNLSDAKVAVSDAIVAHAAGDWANVSDIKVSVGEILTALSDALG